MFIAAMLIGILGMFLSLSFEARRLGVLVWGAGAFAVAWIAALIVTAPLSTYLPFATTRALTDGALGKRFSDFASATWTPQQYAVWVKLARIVAHNYGVRADRILPSTRFVGDKGTLDRVLQALGAK